MTLPRLRLLGYQPTRPRLRVLRLPELEVEPSPVPLNNADSALDNCIRREGWIAFKSFEVWGVPIPLEGKAFRVGPSFDFLPSRNERAIWMMDGHIPPDQPSVYAEYDGVNREVIDRIELRAGMRLARDTAAGLIAHDHQGCYRWERGAAVGDPIDEREAAEPGTLFTLTDDPAKAEIVDAAGHLVPLDLPIAGKWTPRSTSPDGRYYAIDIDISGPREPVSFTDIVQGRARYAPEPHRLGLIDLHEPSITIADGVFDNFATAPVWSDDSQWLVFYAPFQRNRLWACNVADARLEEISFGRRSPPGPLVNVSDLISD